jgi:hypothetical protein
MSDPFGAGRLTGLAVGLAFGLVGAAVCLNRWNWRRQRRPGSPTPVAGLALAAASALGIAITATTRPAGTLLPGLVVLAAAGGLLRRARAAGPGGAAGARAPGLAGAAALALAGATVTAWSLAADDGLALGLWVVAAICVTGALLDDFDRYRQRQGLAPVLLAVSVAGVYGTVPDVEAVVVVVGAALPIALLGWPGPLAWPRSAAAQPPPSLGGAGAFATAGLLVWTVAAGGSARPGSIVGGLACLGLLALEPLSRRLGALGRSGASTAGTLGAPPPLGPGDRLGWALLTAQVVLVAVAARVVGRTVSAPAALLLAAAELAAVLAAAVAVARLRGARRRAPPGGDEISSG